jgi:LysM repeat protein
MRKQKLLVAVCIVLSLAAIWADSVEYVVQKGDTFYSIAKRFGVTVEQLMTMNGITDSSKLKVGMKLLIPTGYVVQKGDTFYSIAKRYGISVDQLLSINGLKAGATLKVGQVLIVPASGVQATASAGGASQGSAASGATGGASVSAIDPKGILSWPCEGERKPISGRLSGVMILAKEKAQSKFVASGTVVWVGPFQGYGLVVFVQGRSGYLYIYGGHETALVRRGDKVVSGMGVGTIGMDMKAKAPVAYFFVSLNGKTVDPAKAPRD